MARQKQKKKGPRIDLNKRINYKNKNFLKLFTSKQGKIIPRRTTKFNLQQQRKLSKAIKKARILSLLPFAEN